MNAYKELVKEWQAAGAWDFEGWLVNEVARLRAELAIATKLYAKARQISIDEATDNIRDARRIQSP